MKDILWYSLDKGEALARAATSLAEGLSKDEVEQRRRLSLPFFYFILTAKRIGALKD